MRKFLLVVMCFGLSTLSLFAQNEQTSENRTYWTVSLSGGVNQYCGEYMNGLDLAGLGKLTATRWYNPVWGLYLQMDGGKLNDPYRDNTQPDNFSFMDAFVGVQTDVLNWGKEKRNDRKVSLYLHGGLGAACAFSRGDHSTKYSPSLMLGADLNVRLNETWGVLVSVDGTMVNDGFNSIKGDAGAEGFAGATVGLVYRLP